MLTKEQIDHYKKQGDGALARFVEANPDNRSVLFVLKNLGYLPQNFETDWVLPLLAGDSQKVRLWAAKTLGKAMSLRTASDKEKAQNLRALTRAASGDESTEVRREAVSSIGRLKTRTIIPVLSEFLDDGDPKVVVQAIRGLLTFKQDENVRKRLAALRDHPNEIIHKVIEKACFAAKEDKVSKQAHALSCDFLKNKVVFGDVREILECVPEESFHLTFTSPPYYNARDYSIYKSYQAYLHFLKEVFHLTHRKTKEGRFLIVNTSPIIIPRVSRQHASRRYPIPFDIHGFLVAMGWEFIDDIVWEKPESSVKNRNAGFLQHRKPLAYKPNAVTEYLMVYRKKTDKLIDWNIRQYDEDTVADGKVADGYETSNIWRIDPTHDKIHSAVFPVGLCERVVKYYSFKGDLVFDPFAGSGTFGRVAKNLGRFFFLTENKPEYFDYMKISLAGRDTLEEQEYRSDFLTLDEFSELS